MRKAFGIAAFVAFAAASGTLVLAQHSGHGGHAGHGATENASPSTKAYEAANAKMHKEMDIQFSGDPDVDLIRGMIPHHRGAIEMAKVALQYGKAPEVRKLAEEIIAAQEKEIAWMNDWLAKNSKK